MNSRSATVLLLMLVVVVIYCYVTQSGSPSSKREGGQPTIFTNPWVANPNPT